MSMHILISIFYIITVVMAILGIFFIQKNDGVLNGICWGIYSIIIFICYQGMTAGVINLFHIPICLITIGIFDLILGAVLLYFIIIKNKKQIYEYEKIDCIFLFIMLLITVILVQKRFGNEISINFQSVDSAAHMKFALNILDKGKISTNLYLSAVNEAMVIGALREFIDSFDGYKIFILCESFFFMLSGLIFYGIIRNYCKNFYQTIAAIILTLFYWLGYPLYSMVFGFSYFGLSIIIIAYLIVMCDLYVDNKIYQKLNIVFLAMGIYSLLVCYTLFVPVVFLAIGLCVANSQHAEKKMFSVDTVVLMLKIFLIPCVLGLIYSIGNIGALTAGGAGKAGIATEGGSYRDLYSDFVLILPLLVTGYYVILIKLKKINLIVTMMPLLLLFMMLLFKLGMNGKVSSYYFCKNHSLLWLVSFVCIFYAIKFLNEKNRIVIIGYLCTYIMLMTFDFRGVDNYIQNTNSNFIDVSSKNFINIYDFTKIWFEQPKFQNEKIDLYRYVNNNLRIMSDVKILIVGTEFEDAWFQTLTEQEYARCNGDINVYNSLVNDDTKYVCVLYGEMYQNNQEYFDGLERIYQNNAGFIAKIN